MDMMAATYAVHTADERAQLDAFLLTYRHLLNETLDGITEAEARRRLVPSRTCLLSLVKHAVYVEKVWFVETVSGVHRLDQGLPADVEDSWLLDDDDTVDSVRAAHRAAFEASEEIAAAHALDDVLTGHQRIEATTLRWVYLHLLRELAQHVGHAEILREIVLAERTG